MVVPCAIADRPRAGERFPDALDAKLRLPDRRDPAAAAKDYGQWWGCGLRPVPALGSLLMARRCPSTPVSARLECGFERTVAALPPP